MSPGVGAVARDAVADAPIWFRWKLEPNEKGALTKVPYCAHHEGQASHTKPRDWGTLTQARASLERWGGNGLGIVAAAIDDQYVHACLDVDGCYPPDSSKRDEWVEPAAAILAGCYHERSFSQTGEHYHFLIRREGAEVHTANAAFSAGATQVEPGDYVVRMDQPYNAIVETLLGTQFYAPENPRPYDDTGWAIPLVRNLKTSRIEDKSILEKPMTLAAADFRIAGAITGAGRTFNFGLRASF